MAVNVTVFDLVNFPNNPKTVTVDLTEVVPLGNSGEDVWVFTSNTTATASGGAAIQRLYINNMRLGWAKSSGLIAGPYNVLSSARHLKIAIDEDIASAAQIALEYNDSLPLNGDDIARDVQNKLNAVARPGGTKAGNLSYLNATVTYSDNTFMIVSGSASASYTGSEKSSVAIADGTTTTGLAAVLGFDIVRTSEVLASTQIKETSLSIAYSSPGPSSKTVILTHSGRVASGDCIAITDGSNTEFRGVESSFGATLTLASGLANTYAAGSKVQVLRLQDASGEPPPAYMDVDSYIKYGISTIVNQIHFG